jgi:MoaA/NifB/PqqE/SkfB family radical SAM enzyme
MMPISPGAAAPQNSDSVQFLWLELTNLCNLQCVHCYAESSPFRAGDDLLGAEDYRDVLSTAAQLGCRQVQFIGGEPLSQPLLDCFVEHDVNIATSVYSHRAEIHDEITRKPGSHRQTMRGIDAVLAAQLRLRAGVITMPLNQGHVEETVEFLLGKGVPEVGRDHVREFGRGSEEAGEESLANLCGNCAGSTLCVAPSGKVSSCIMSKAWSVGSIRETPLAEVVESDRLRNLRRRIYDHTVAPREAARVAPHADCEPSCSPSCYPSCVPACAPSCVPSCQPSCAPSCFPSCVPACQPSR